MKTTALTDKKIVLAVTGGIAAYKALLLLRLLQKHGAEVRVAMTKSASAFVGPLSFAAISKQNVLQNVLDLDRTSSGVRIGHVSVAAEADAVVIAPATANFIARYAAGLADDAISAILLATEAPVLLAPAMEHHMWWHPATQTNMASLEKRGVIRVGPGSGALASGAEGRGRMAEPEEILQALIKTLSAKRDLLGRRIVITAGPTQEAIDPVRFLSNHATGRMGFALASAAFQRGAEVELIYGPTALTAPSVQHVQALQSASDMADATLQAAKNADAVIMAAAVADYTPVTVADRKLAKTEQVLDEIRLKRTQDILQELCANRNAAVIVGFATETQDFIERGRQKRKRKGADLLIANLVGVEGTGFAGANDRAALIFNDDSVEDLGVLQKNQLAEIILDKIAAILPNKERS